MAVCGRGVAVCVIRLVVPVAVGWVGVYGCRSGGEVTYHYQCHVCLLFLWLLAVQF